MTYLVNAYFSYDTSTVTFIATKADDISCDESKRGSLRQLCSTGANSNHPFLVINNLNLEHQPQLLVIEDTIDRIEAEMNRHKRIQATQKQTLDGE